MNSDNTGNRPWWSPKIIEAQEAKIRALADVGELDTRNDFASYRALADGADPIEAGLHHHNPYTDEHIFALCRDYVNVFGVLGLHSPRRIVDLGCGAGYTTAGLKRVWPDSVVEGIEVSHDAVRFANATFIGCAFRAKAIDPAAELSEFRYDLILCQEFYPFTRTAELAEHETWLEFIKNNLSNSGIAIVTVTASNRESINATYSELRKKAKVKRFQITVPRLSRRLPFHLARIAGTILGIFKPIWVRNVYVVMKRV